MPHQQLSLKLYHYGVRGNILELVKSSLGGRRHQIILDSTAFSAAPVTSGVPQGTVLGQLLFLVDTNDLPSCVKSSARLFADDRLLYRRINPSADIKALQEELDNLQQWEKDWQMKFKPDKCEGIHIINKRSVVDSEYTIHGQILRHTVKAKYLGVTIDGTLSWNNHIDTMAKKANSTTVFLRRNLSSCSPYVKATFYIDLCAPS